MHGGDQMPAIVFRVPLVSSMRWRRNLGDIYVLVLRHFGAPR